MESKRRLEELVKNLPGMLYRCLHDADWTLEFVSDGVHDLIGFTPTQLVEEKVVSISELVHPDDLESVSLSVETALAAKTPFRMTYRMRNADGEYRWVWEQGYGEFSAAGDLLALEGFVTDVTQRVNAERALREQQKLEALGQLARGVAHDLNNLLTVIASSSQLLAFGDVSSSQSVELDAINDAVERANRLTQQLMGFSKPAESTLRIVDVNQTLVATSGLLRRVIDESIHIELDITDEPTTVAIASGELEQILTNLAINARDAMPDGGALTLRTTRTQLEAAPASERAAGEYVVIDVIDTGSGMAPDVGARIFEPFFTTKPSDQGTGLGLSVVQAALRRHGGNIEVESTPGSGTRFSVVLPWVDRMQESPVTSERGAVVLVVDDEEAIRRGLRTVLQKAGFVVLEAGSVAQAIHLSERHRGTIAAAVIDYQLGDGDGVSLGKTLTEQRPEMNAILISGTFQPDDELAAPFKAFIPKPFSLESVLEQVTALVDE